MKSRDLALGLSLLAAHPTGAAPVASVVPGSKVRIQAPDVAAGTLQGRVAAIDGASIMLLTGDSQMSLPREAIQRLELHTGTKRQWRRGTLIGAAVGFGLGFTTDVDDIQCRFERYVSCSRGEALAAGAAAGALLGLGIGALIKRDLWSEVPLASLRVSVAPGRRGFSGSVAFSF
jgi:hypothetical protein